MKYFPVKFHVIYIIFTILFNFFGPRIYQNYNKIPVTIFIFTYLVIIYIGFKFGVNSKINTTNKLYKSNNLYNLFLTCLNISIILYILLFIYLYSTGRISFSLSSIGQNYNDFYKYYNEKKETEEFTLELLFLIALAIPKYISLTIGFLKYKLHNKKIKYKFFSLVALIVIINTISAGNQKSLGDIIIIALFSILANYKNFSQTDKRKTKLIGFLVLGLSLVFFSFSQFQRLDSRSISLSDLNRMAPDYYSLDENHPIFKIFGEKMGLGLTAFISGYLANGYYGLSICLDMPIKWSYGIGNSVALTNLFEKFLHCDIYSKTYLSGLDQYGLYGKMHWHTIFPWFASDFTFAGTLLIFIPISYYYGKVWKEILLFNNDVSFLLFCLLSIMFIFVPANNQILHGYDSFICSVFVVFYWIKNHKSYNYK